MKKPRHRIAVLLWLAGIAVLLLWMRAMFDFVQTGPVRGGNYRGLEMGVVAGAVLIALGTIVELVDRIRWKSRPPEVRRQSASAWTFLRRRPRSSAD